MFHLPNEICHSGANHSMIFNSKQSLYIYKNIGLPYSPCISRHSACLCQVTGNPLTTCSIEIKLDYDLRVTKK